MSNTIAATVSESFELTVSPSEGFMGEHNAEMLEINISTLIQGGYDYYVIIFDDMSVNGVIKSNEIRSNEDYPAYLDSETIFCPLSSQLTSTGKLKIQIEAHKFASAGSLIKKTSVASIEFKPSIMSGTDKEFDSSSLSRLDNIENSLRNLKTQLEALSVIPLATTESIGGIRLSGKSPVQLDNNGAATINVYNLDAAQIIARLILEIIAESDNTQVLYVRNCDEVANLLDGLTYDMCNGIYSSVVFCTETSGKTYYCNGNYDSVELNAEAGDIYVFNGREEDFTLTQYNRYSFRKLILEGV